MPLNFRIITRHCFQQCEWVSNSQVGQNSLLCHRYSRTVGVQRSSNACINSWLDHIWEKTICFVDCLAGGSKQLTIWIILVIAIGSSLFVAAAMASIRCIMQCQVSTTGNTTLDFEATPNPEVCAQLLPHSLQQGNNKSRYCPEFIVWLELAFSVYQDTIRYSTFVIETTKLHHKTIWLGRKSEIRDCMCPWGSVCSRNPTQVSP